MAVTMRYRRTAFSISVSSAGGVISNICTTTTYRGLPGFLVPHETVSTLVANHQGLRLHESPVKASTQGSGSPLLSMPLSLHYLNRLSSRPSMTLPRRTESINRTFIPYILTQSRICFHPTPLSRFYLFQSLLHVDLLYKLTIRPWLETSSSCTVYILTFILQ